MPSTRLISSPSPIYLYTFALTDTTIQAHAVQVRPIQAMFRQELSITAHEEMCQLTQIILSLTLQTNEEDRAVWKWATTGQFTVRIAYMAFKSPPTIANYNHIIWKLKAPPRFKVFGWLMLINKILTIDNLVTRGWCMVNRCVMCKFKVSRCCTCSQSATIRCRYTQR